MAKRAARGEHPDTVFVDGRILTMVGDEPTYAEAVAISAGRIVFVGSREEALQRFPAAELHDLNGNTLLPGFIDAHSHLSFGIDKLTQANIGSPPMGDCTDIASVIATLEAFRAEKAIAPGEWIVGSGYDQECLAEARHITTRDLDGAFPNNPVLLIHVSGHGAVLNSRALKWAHIDASTQAPTGGIIARYDGSREPSGLLMETAYLQLVAERMPRSSVEERVALLDDVQQLYASNGYTHIQDGFCAITDLDVLQLAAGNNAFYLDVVALGSFIEAQNWIGNSGYPVGEYRNGFKLAGMKIVQDGSPQGRTAYMSQPYLIGAPTGEAGWRGEPSFSYDELAEAVHLATDAGVQVFSHVNGDAAIDDFIRAVRASGVTAADDRRPVAIHSQFQRSDQLEAYLELGVTASYFTNHVYYWGDVHVANVGRQKAAGISPMNSARERGIMVSNHSDFTVTPLDPFFIMWTAITRTTRTGAVLGEAERIDAYAALQAMTVGGAFQMFEEKRKGSIAEGLLADLVIVSANPLETPANELRAIRVLETIKEGITVYHA